MRRLAAGVRKSVGTRHNSADTPPDRGKGISTVFLPLATIMVMVLASSATRAAQQTVLFEGTVTGFTQITGSLATDLASLGVTVGATITGSYAYDSEAPDQIGSACAGLYPTTAISFSIGSFAGAGGALILITEHHLPDCFVTPPDDAYQVTAADIPSPGSIDTITYPDYDFDFLLEDSTGTAFDSDSLPTSAPDLLNFDSQSGFIRFRSTTDGFIHDVNFSIDSFEVHGCLLLELRLSGAGNTLLSWDDRPEAQSYCVERGNLDVLRATRGDFTLSIAEELASHTMEASLLFGGTPERGQAYWFLVRDNPAGTFDSGCLSQVDNRDDEILNAGDICVN